MIPWKHVKFIVKVVTDRVPAEFVLGKRHVVGDPKGPARDLTAMLSCPPYHRPCPYLRTWVIQQPGPHVEESRDTRLVHYSFRFRKHHAILVSPCSRGEFSGEIYVYHAQGNKKVVSGECSRERDQIIGRHRQIRCINTCMVSKLDKSVYIHAKIV
jgi:hypothetical protein